MDIGILKHLFPIFKSIMLEILTTSHSILLTNKLFSWTRSLNVHADGHIYHRIKQSSFDSIYFGIYDNDDNDLIKRISSWGWSNGKKIAFFDPTSTIDWKEVEDNDDDFW